MSKLKLNSVTSRFLPLSKSVSLGLEPESKISDFEILNHIGSGTFGYVVEARHIKTRMKFALKVIDKTNKNNLEGKPYFRREIEIMYKINHPNIVHLFGHFEDEKYCYFIMEYIPNGNLYSYLSNMKNNSINTFQVASFIKDIISAVYYLHNMNPPIIHRDIKPENILLTSKGKVKLTDFGWSNYVDLGEERNTFCGTPLYLVPEMLLMAGHDYRVDIWCIGVLLFELITGNPPFIGTNRLELKNNIIAGKINWPKSMDDDAKNLIEKILKVDYRIRPGLKDIIEHRFFKKFFKNPEECLIKSDNSSERPFVVSKDFFVGDAYDWRKVKKKNEKRKNVIIEKLVLFLERDLN